MNEILTCSPYIIAGLKDMGDLPEKKKRNEGKIVPITPEDILSATSKYLNIPIEKILLKGGKRSVIYARKICVYLLRIYTDNSLNKIKEILNHALTDHTSVLHCEVFIRTQISGKRPNKDIIHDLEAIVQIVKSIETIKFNSINNN